MKPKFPTKEKLIRLYNLIKGTKPLDGKSFEEKIIFGFCLGIASDSEKAKSLRQHYTNGGDYSANAYLTVEEFLLVFAAIKAIAYPPMIEDSYGEKILYTTEGFYAGWILANIQHHNFSFSSENKPEWYNEYNDYIVSIFRSLKENEVLQMKKETVKYNRKLKKAKEQGRQAALSEIREAILKLIPITQQVIDVTNAGMDVTIHADISSKELLNILK